MVAQTAGKGHAFAVPAEPEEVVFGVEVLHPHHLLLDDGALVEVRRGVVAGGADELHPALIRPVVGISPDKGGQETVVNVHKAGGPAGAHLERQDLHVTGKHHQIRLRLRP